MASAELCHNIYGRCLSYRLSAILPRYDEALLWCDTFFLLKSCIEMSYNGNYSLVDDRKMIENRGSNLHSMCRGVFVSYLDYGLEGCMAQCEWVRFYQQNIQLWIRDFNEIRKIKI